MIATIAQAPNPLSFLADFMAPEGEALGMPTDFAALLSKLDMVSGDGGIPKTAEAREADAETDIDSEDDGGPVPKGLERIADALSAALAAVMAAAGKPAETGLGQRPGVTTTAPQTPVATGSPVTSLSNRHPELVSGSTPQLAPPLGAAFPTPATILSAQVSLLPIIASLEAATAAGDTPPAPMDAGIDQPATAVDRPAPLPLLALPIATPPAASSAVPTTAPDTSSIQPQSSSEIVMGHHLDLAKDGAWLDRLARDIARTASHDAHLRFQLNPEHLGSLRVELANTADGTAIRLTADTDAARNILVDAQPRLIAEARAQGLRISEAQVDLGSQGGQQRSHQENPQTVVRTQKSVDEQPARPRRSAERYA